MISVVIPARNAAETLSGCLTALARQTVAPSEYEIILVDDGSTDDTASIGLSHPIRLIQQPQSSLAAARNAGLAIADGEIVLFTEADCEPAPDWVAQMAAAFDNPEVAGVRGVYRTRQRSLVARFVQIEYEDRYDYMSSRSAIDFVDTYSAGYRRQVLLANEGFDTAFPHLADQELSFRLTQRGYRLVFQPSALVYHHHIGRLGAYVRRKLTIGFWKAQVGRRYPDQLVRDSHTPQVVRIQITLLALALLLSVGSVLWRPLFSWVLAIWLSAALTTIPFAVKAWRKDRVIGIVAPLLLLIRALSLGFGYAAGLLSPQGGVIGGKETTIGGWSYWVKRAMDVVGAMAGLLVSLPLWPLIGLAIKLDSPGPVFFRQTRVGAKGRSFTCLKFRSMVADAEEQLDDLVDLSSLESPAFKLIDDPRVTRVGRLLRRLSLDELPQFWNVLVGDMSLVGPRPEEARVVALYSDWHRRRLAVKPGLTGPMQVNGRADLSLEERLMLEIDYIEHYSLRRDIAILLRTVPAVLTGRGAR